MDYKELLASIARDKGDIDLSEYILKYEKVIVPRAGDIITKTDSGIAGTVEPKTTTKYNITVMPEATCDGCQ
jgi:hypothetical protein